MGRTRDVSKILTSNTSILTLASASTTYATKASIGLSFINSASFTSASTISLPENTFTSTYDNYKIVFSNFSCTSGHNINIQFRKAGSNNATNGSYGIGGGTGAYSSTWSTFNTSGNSALLAVVPATTSNLTLDVMVYDPKINKATQFVTNSIHTTTANFVGGIHTVVDSFDSMTFIFSSGTVSGTYSVFGFNK